MKSITSTWFECIVAYDKVTEEGTLKKVTETRTVDALTFTEAESTITSEMAKYISGEFDIKNINPAQYKEVFFSEEEKDDHWFKVKVAFITYDEKTMKEKYSNVFYLVQADKSETANAHTNEVLGTGMQDYRIVSNVETKILDVIRHEQ
jgi:hypothetical protein